LVVSRAVFEISTHNATQESLAIAKVSARQPWYIGHNSPSGVTPSNINVIYRCTYIVEEYFSLRNNSVADNANLSSFFSICCLPKMQSSAKFRENMNL